MTAGRTAGLAVDAARLVLRRFRYAPSVDGDADPGEVVWTRVAFEDQPSRWKDRPVLVVGRATGGKVLALMLTSQAHRDGQRHWLPLGRGAWDGKLRRSWVRLDRVLELDEAQIRRECVALDPARFRRVCERLREGYGWSSADTGGG
jgi:hypothetical protein